MKTFRALFEVMDEVRPCETTPVRTSTVRPVGTKAVAVAVAPSRTTLAP